MFHHPVDAYCFRCLLVVYPQLKPAYRFNCLLVLNPQLKPAYHFSCLVIVNPQLKPAYCFSCPVVVNPKVSFSHVSLLTGATLLYLPGLFFLSFLLCLLPLLLLHLQVSVSELDFWSSRSGSGYKEIIVKYGLELWMKMENYKMVVQQINISWEVVFLAWKIT